MTRKGAHKHGQVGHLRPFGGCKLRGTALHFCPDSYLDGIDVSTAKVWAFF